MIAATLFCGCSDDSDKKSEQDTCTQDKCENWCGDFKTDNTHCGNCETQCKAGEYCNGGTCASIDSCTQDKCDNWCGDFQRDAKHCGNCQTDCTQIETSTGVCKQGQCESNVVSCKDETDANGNVTHHRKLCETNGKSVCMDIDNDPNNCGECGEKCDPAETCSLGECTSTASCVLPSFVCQVTVDDESGQSVNKEVCVNPESSNTCGIKTCEEFNSLKDHNSLFACKDGFSCALVNNQYECSCSSNIVHDGKCLDPSSNLSCGAGQNGSQDVGMVCPSGTKCVPYEDKDSEKKYHCSCASGWQLSCYHESDTGVDCINPAIDDSLCSAKDCGDTSHQCAIDQKCSDGLCVCKEQYVTCNGRCIDPLTDNTYCGAKGNCTNTPEDVTNSAGTTCGQNEVCENGKCVCDLDSILCNGECLKEGSDKICNITVNDNNCEITDCTKINGKCALHSGRYQCDCEADHVPCNGVCIDPLTNSYHCGAKGTCQNENASSNNYIGENCTENTDGKNVCVNGKCESKCAEGYANCNGICVIMADYHINRSCTGCDADHCYTGDVDENGNIINFDYKKCLDFDENGKDLNKLRSDNYCGITCKTSVACSPDLSCDNIEAKCWCDKSNKLLCTQFKTDDPNAETKCVSKVETHQTACGVCEEGWLDCDGDLWNGCEVDSKTRVDHCGSCDNNCHTVIQNASGVACVEGQCTYAYCKEDWGDCDKVQNGCEQSGLMNDPNHCGQCNNVCPYGGCNHSVCCAIDGKESPHSSDLICCDGLKKYKYNHKGWWVFGSCPNDDHYGCYANNPDANCWSEVE